MNLTIVTGCNDCPCLEDHRDWGLCKLGDRERRLFDEPLPFSVEEWGPALPPPANCPLRGDTMLLELDP